MGKLARSKFMLGFMWSWQIKRETGQTFKKCLDQDTPVSAVVNKILTEQSAIG